MTALYMWIVPRFNRLRQVDNRPSRLLPRTMGAFLCLFLVTSMTIVADQLLDYIYDLRSLRQTIRRNDQHLKGGQEFYEKLIQRNQALFELLGEQGPKIFTSNGHVKRLFGLYTTSYETHLDYINLHHHLTHQ